MTKQKPPKELDAIADIVLAYRPKPKTKAAKQRKRLSRKLSRIAPQIDRAKKERDY